MFIFDPVAHGKSNEPNPHLIVTGIVLLLMPCKLRTYGRRDRLPLYGLDSAACYAYKQQCDAAFIYSSYIKGEDSH